MESMILLDKQVGETPLACLERFKKNNPEYQQVKMTYAGRLDPMASGLLIVLAGDAVHDKDSFLRLPKTYECTAILGIQTDTHDVLGIPTLIPVQEYHMPSPGTFIQKYPPYSSKTINGTQMHQLARAGELDDKEIPTQTVTVQDISKSSSEKVSVRDLVDDIIASITLVQGDFRQDEIIQAWQRLAEEDREIEIVSFTITVSGGTYIRGIVHDMGGCIWKLHRTRIGEYFLP